jgi:hypothetical protein
MARTKEPAKAKEPGRLKQMWDVFQMTRRYDSRAIYWMVGGLVIPIILGLILAFTLSGGNLFNTILWIVAGIMAGILALLVILGRRAEKAAYSQIEGQPGAVGAVLKSNIRRGWQASEMPINVSPRTQDAVYRAIGRGGVVLIGEGPKSRTQRMLDEERRTVARVLPNVPINFLYVGPDQDSIPLYKLSRNLRRFKPVLRKAEIMAVSNRLSSLAKPPMGIPKGVDPFKARAQRPR